MQYRDTPQPWISSCQCSVEAHTPALDQQLSTPGFNSASCNQSNTRFYVIIKLISQALQRVWSLALHASKPVSAF